MQRSVIKVLDGGSCEEDLDYAALHQGYDLFTLHGKHVGLFSDLKLVRPEGFELPTLWFVAVCLSFKIPNDQHLTMH